MRKLASIQTIAEILPIDGADSIEKARINGWWSVVKKGEFSVGQKVVYLEVDSWVPTEVAPFLSSGKEPRVFEGVRGERLRTVRLRGQLSQGLILPLSVCQYQFYADPQIGDDATDILNIKKWEKPAPAQLAGQAKGCFPDFLHKTDQERIQNCLDVISDSDTKYEVTLKLDGSSCTVYYYEGVVGVCSRNLELKVNEDNQDNSFIRIAHDTGLLDALRAYGRNVAVQGELMGPGIQGNREKLDKNALFVFDVWDIDSRTYLPPEERRNTFIGLWAFGYTGHHVPILSHESSVVSCGKTLEELLVFADRPSLNHAYAEGVVFKATDGSKSFKVINNRFLLKED